MKKFTVVVKCGRGLFTFSSIEASTRENAGSIGKNRYAATFAISPSQVEIFSVKEIL